MNKHGLLIASLLAGLTSAPTLQSPPRQRLGARGASQLPRHEKLKRPRLRLRIARGAGSISAKADITQLANAGRYAEALAMAKAHEHQCGERLFAGAWAQWGEA